MMSGVGLPGGLLATWFGVGLFPWAPGTMGSLAALPLGWLCWEAGGSFAVVLAGLVILIAGVSAAQQYGEAVGKTDDGSIVVDEVAGQLLPLAFLAPNPVDWAAAFAAFRLFDILKPWPASFFDRRSRNSKDVMADDLVAGVYAAAAVLALKHLAVL